MNNDFYRGLTEKEEFMLKNKGIDTVPKLTRHYMQLYKVYVKTKTELNKIKKVSYGTTNHNQH